MEASSSGDLARWGKASSIKRGIQSSLTCRLSTWMDLSSQGSICNAKQSQVERRRPTHIMWDQVIPVTWQGITEWCSQPRASRSHFSNTIPLKVINHPKWGKPSPLYLSSRFLLLKMSCSFRRGVAWWSQCSQPTLCRSRVSLGST